MPKKVLIVDDDPFILDMYSLKLRELDFDIETAMDGKVALEKLAKFSPDVVLLDIILPVMDGFEMLMEMKRNKDFGKVKVILLTNLGEKHDIERGRALGADDYIIKAHFTPTEVVEKIKNLLDTDSHEQ